MTKIAIILFVVLFAGFAVFNLSGKAPLRGMAHAPASPEAVLLARARPALTVDRAPNMPLLA